MPKWMRIRFVQPLLQLLKTGLSPRKLAHSVAFGMVLGIFPAPGCSALLCAVAAVGFKLNMAAIQIVNYLAYPAQFLLMIPFFRLGGWLFHAAPIQLSPSVLILLIKDSPRQAIYNLWIVIGHAAVAWLILAPLFIAVLSIILTPIFERAARQSVGVREKIPADFRKP